jgi:hypothetical protein
VTISITKILRTLSKRTFRITKISHAAYKNITLSITKKRDSQHMTLSIKKEPCSIRALSITKIAAQYNKECNTQH